MLWKFDFVGLSELQEKMIAQEISDLEKDTGFKLRVLAQNYLDTPGMLKFLCWFERNISKYLYRCTWWPFFCVFETGLAIKDFWQVDDNTIVFVADPTFGNITNIHYCYYSWRLSNGKLMVMDGFLKQEHIKLQCLGYGWFRHIKSSVSSLSSPQNIYLKGHIKPNGEIDDKVKIYEKSLFVNNL